MWINKEYYSLKRQFRGKIGHYCHRQCTSDIITIPFSYHKNEKNIHQQVFIVSDKTTRNLDI